MESSLTQVGISFTKQKKTVSFQAQKKKFFLYKVEGVFGDRLFNYWCLDKEKKKICPRWLILKGLFCVNWLRKTCEKGKF